VPLHRKNSEIIGVLTSNYKKKIGILSPSHLLHTRGSESLAPYSREVPSELKEGNIRLKNGV
jgi:hypothetical protein